MSKEIQVTKEGYEKLKIELAKLNGPTRMAVADAIREAKSHGDLRENAAYHEAKLNQTRLEKQISDLEHAILHARIIERPEGHENSAHLGSVVTLEDEEFGDEITITLVGSFEADPANDLVSVGSPLGEAVFGKLVGENIVVVAPQGESRFKIKKIVV
jgi:transcription elongation factor GreA